MKIVQEDTIQSITFVTSSIKKLIPLCQKLLVIQSSQRSSDHPQLEAPASPSNVEDDSEPQSVVSNESSNDISPLLDEQSSGSSGTEKENDLNSPIEGEASSQESSSALTTEQTPSQSVAVYSDDEDDSSSAKKEE